jgi:hypothetical protein
MLKHREHSHSDIVQINPACVPTPYPGCDWRCDKLAMIIGPSPGIQYCMQVSTRMLSLPEML